MALEFYDIHFQKPEGERVITLWNSQPEESKLEIIRSSLNKNGYSILKEISYYREGFKICFLSSTAEHSAVNGQVLGSAPRGNA